MQYNYFQSFSTIQFSNTSLQYQSPIQVSNASLQYKSPIQVSNNSPIDFICMPHSPQLLPLPFLLLLLWSWQLVSKKKVCPLSCQSLRHLHIQSFFPATSKVADPENFTISLHKRSSPQKILLCHKKMHRGTFGHGSLQLKVMMGSLG